VSSSPLFLFATSSTAGLGGLSNRRWWVTVKLRRAVAAGDVGRSP
jgi:hypothetical protein